MATSNSVIQECSVCPSTEDLMRCTRCQVVFYCSREHQTSHWPSHKPACSAVSKKRTKLETEYEKLRTRGHFDTIGQFWGRLETRPYMRARFAFIDALGAIDTRDAVEAQLEHELDMLRLSRVDNMGMRELVPFAMLRTGRDQDCYDFLKWQFNTGSDPEYDWGDMTLGYQDVKNADALESTERLHTLRHDNLAHYTALLLLKTKLLLDLITRTPSNPIITNNQAVLDMRDDVEMSLLFQISHLHFMVHVLNPSFFYMLFSAQLDLTDRPRIFTHGSREQAQLVLVYSYRAWVETPGALNWIKLISDEKNTTARPGRMRSPSGPILHIKTPYALTQEGDRTV